MPRKERAKAGFFLCKMIHLLSSDLEIQTYMIKMHLFCQNYHKKRHVQFLLHELMCMDYVFLADRPTETYQQSALGITSGV